MAGQELEIAANAQAAAFHHGGSQWVVYLVYGVLQVGNLPIPPMGNNALVGELRVGFEQNFILCFGNFASKGQDVEAFVCSGLFVQLVGHGAAREQRGNTPQPGQ